MIAVQDLEEITDRLLCSCCVEDTQPISAMLIAPSDAGKSKLAIGSKHSGDRKFVRVLADCTGEAITKYININKPRYLIFPDFNMVLSHRPVTAKYTIAVLLALLGEGAREIPDLDGRDKLALDEATRNVAGLRAGVLLCLTPEMFRSHRGHWRRLGLLRRLLPISYEYNPATMLRIVDAIVDGKVSPVYAMGNTPLPAKRKVQVSHELKHRISRIATVVQEKLVWVDRYRNINRATDYPFSMINALLRYAQASAIANGSNEVGDREYADVEKLSKYISVEGAVQI